MSASSPQRSSRAVFAHLYRTCVRPLRGLLAALVALSFAANVFDLLQPLILAGMLAALLGPTAPPATARPPVVFDLSYLGARVLARLGSSAHDSMRNMPLLAVMFLGQVLLAAAFAYAASMVAHRIKVRSTMLVQTELAGHLLSLSLRFFHRERAGELQSRFLQDIRNTAQGLGPLVQSVINDAMQIVLLGVLLLSTSTWLTLGAVLLVGVHFALTELMKRPSRRLARTTFDTAASLSTTLQEGLANIRVTKSFGAEQFEFGKLRDAIANVARVYWRYGFLEKAEVPIRSIVDSSAILGILLIAITELHAGRLTTQGVLLYLYVGRMLIAPISHTATNALAVQALLASYDRVEELLAEEPELVSGSQLKTTFSDRITLDGVSFAYGEERVVDDVCIQIRRGEMVALVGPSGAGKSTLVDLILRLYDPDRGGVRIDGIDVRDLQQPEYLRLFGVVPQESLLFHDSVKNNIRYGRPNVTDEDIIAAARVANADGFIDALPEGYDTLVGDRGVRLSGGERQRIAIARAVAHRPQILVLDEATSSLDSESEHQVQQAIDRIVKQTTAIVIAHRLSTVLHADRIVVVERGRVLDSGRHGELLERCALYRSLCERQFQMAAKLTNSLP